MLVAAAPLPYQQGRSRPGEGDGVLGLIICSRNVVLLDPLLQ
jgi:hypothetical protein